MFMVPLYHVDVYSQITDLHHYRQSVRHQAMKPHKRKKWTKTSVTKLRKRLGLTQAEFAEALGINRQQTVSEWEIGKFDTIRPAHQRLLDMLAERTRR